MLIEAFRRKHTPRRSPGSVDTNYGIVMAVMALGALLIGYATGFWHGTEQGYLDGLVHASNRASRHVYPPVAIASIKEPGRLAPQQGETDAPGE